MSSTAAVTAAELFAGGDFWTWDSRGDRILVAVVVDVNDDAVERVVTRALEDLAAVPGLPPAPLLATGGELFRLGWERRSMLRLVMRTDATLVGDALPLDVFRVVFVLEAGIGCATETELREGVGNRAEPAFLTGLFFPATLCLGLRVTLFGVGTLSARKPADVPLLVLALSTTALRVRTSEVSPTTASPFPPCPPRASRKSLELLGFELK